MTEVQARPGDGQPGTPGSGRQQPGPAGRTSYLRLLRMPGAAGFSVAGMVGRMPMAMFGLGTVLLISSVTGKYGLAGAVAAAGSIGYAICAPLAGRLSDALGQDRVLRPMAALFGAATAMFVASAELHAPRWALVLAGGLAGASMPSIGSMVRTRWSTLLRGDQGLLQTAFALESVADELIFVVGPALVTVLATQVFPAAGVLVSAALCLTGTLLFAAQRRTQPPAHPRQRQPHHPAGRPRRRGLRARLPTAPSRALVTLAPMYLFLGAMFATIDLSTVAFAQQHHHKPLAGILLGTYAGGSAIGGLWYGSRSWRAPLERRFTITLCCTVACVASFWALPGLPQLAGVLLVSGLTISPTLMAGYGLIERQATAGRRTEGMAWLSSTISIGVAGGSAIAGQLIDAGGARWGYEFAASCGLLAVAVCLLGLSRLRATPVADPAQWADARDGRA
ncbi:MAG TPA: MFS transporter [Streptosporangiaceae bacterium]